ncbi:hypothetical protein D8I35_07600 [Corticibacter populi]|uniref:Uncharacterized protein n=1 Tax=Corticibacter populi TaxID=1550736 RepID=A0A3M6QTM6_9BURK|nr:hypothetical protein D8I35_07600 [Corticibacter populi]
MVSALHCNGRRPALGMALPLLWILRSRGAVRLCAMITDADSPLDGMAAIIGADEPSRPGLQVRI